MNFFYNLGPVVPSANQFLVYTFLNDTFENL